MIGPVPGKLPPGAICSELQGPVEGLVGLTGLDVAGLSIPAAGRDPLRRHDLRQVPPDNRDLFLAKYVIEAPKTELSAAVTGISCLFLVRL